jgi:hypothetical protein
MTSSPVGRQVSGRMRVVPSAVPFELPSAGVFAAYHEAGHAIAARAIESRPTSEPPATRPKSAAFEDWLNFTAAGHAAERELACRSGLRWRRVVSNAAHDLEACHRLIHEQTGEDHRAWILLHWTRAVARATRLLTVRWGEVVALAESNARMAGGTVAVCSARARSTADAPQRALGGAGPPAAGSHINWWDELLRRQRVDDFPRSRSRRT